MANPILSRSGPFKEGGYATFNNAPAAPQFGQAGDMTSQQLHDMYGAPAAGPLETNRLTYDDVIMKTGICFAVLLVGAAAVGAMFFTGSTPATRVTHFQPGPMAGLGLILGIVGAIAGLVLGLVLSFKKNPSAALTIAYAACQGLFMGLISSMFEAKFSGIVIQAVIGTLAVFGVTLALYRSGKFRVTPKMNKIFMIGMIGYGVFALVSFGFSMFGGGTLRTGPIGLIVGLLAVALASYSLVMDFDTVENGVRNGVPAKFAWTAAFGLLATLIWLYVEILRILSILRGDD